MNDVKREKILLSISDHVLSDLVMFSLQGSFNFEVIDRKNKENEKYLGSNISEVSLFIMSDKEELKRIFNHIKVPILHILDKSGIVDEIQESTRYVSIEIDNALDSIKKNIKEFFEAIDSENKETFIPIAARTLVRFDAIDDDIFIQLPSKRYLKLFNKYDQINEEDVARYSSKGVDFLFLKAEVARWILKEITDDFKLVLDKLRDGDDVSFNPESKPMESNDTAQKVSETLCFDKEFMLSMSMTMNKTVGSLKKNPKLSKLFKKLKVLRDENHYFNSHIGLLCNISCGIANAMNWTTDATLNKLVFVCYMHDITLADYPEISKYQTIEELDKDRDKFSAEEILAWEKHPEDVALLVETLPDSPAEAETIILQHHERPERGGFPHRIPNQRIIPMSAVFIVSHHLVNFILSNEKWSIKDYILEYESIFKGGNFRKVFTALKEIEKNI